MNGQQIAANLFAVTDAGYVVRPIPTADTKWLLLNVHYARRMPTISHAFGLFRDGELAGVVTYGVPPTNGVRIGLFGRNPRWKILELNRLCLVENRPNEASRLVAGSLALLPKPCAVISFADLGQNHEGIVYQATNFLYTGLSAKRSDYRVKGLENVHNQTIADTVRNSKGRRIDALRARFGDRLQLVDRSRKHRYVMFVGSKGQKRAMMADLKYPVVAYPKKLDEPNASS